MTGIAGLPELFPSLTAIVIAVPRPLLVRMLCWSTFGAIVAPREKFRRWNVRFGSEADIHPPSADVRFTPNSGHRNSVLKSPLSAKSGHPTPAALRCSPQSVATRKNRVGARQPSCSAKAKYAVKFGSRPMRLIDHNQVNGLAGED